MKSFLCHPEVFCKLNWSFYLTIFISLTASLSLTAQIPALAEAVIEIINPSIIYDPSYISIDYPNGDVRPDRGVCTDVIIMAYRIIGIDLQ